MGRPGAVAGRRAAAALAVLLAAGLSAPAALAVQPAPTVSSAGSATVGGAGLAGPGVLFDRTAGVPAPPAVAAASYVLADLDTGDVLVAKAPHAPHLPASTLKVLTALTVMPRLDPAMVVTAQRDDVVDGSLVGVVPGLTYTVQQLLHGMMLSSGNDAATALAREAGGAEGVAGTVKAMQQTANHLGARDTIVRDPSGLDAPGQVTSAYDLALIAREALRDPHFEALVSTRRVRFPGKSVVAKPKAGAAVPGTATSPATTTSPRRASFEIQNHNTLLYNYDGAIGVKNGYTVAARWTIVGAAERDGRRYVVTALKRGDRSWRPTAALLDWAFTYGSRVQPVGRLVAAGELDRPAVEGDPAAASVLAVGSAATSTGEPAPRRWVGAVGLACAAALLGLMAVRARRLRLSARRVSVREGRTPRRVHPDRPS